jgi:hypothetical protein
MFADYLDETIYGIDQYDHLDIGALAAVAEIESDMGQQCAMYGTSPTSVIWTR